MNDQKKYILIVDDNINNLEISATILKDEGYLISLAQDARSALKQLDRMIPDLILLDIMMPGMDGIELCRILKKNDKLADIPVVFLTAKNQPEDLAEGFKAGGVDYITKPFNREEMILRVKNHVDLADARKKLIEANRNRDILYSVIAHDIKSPLSSISISISALNEGYISPDSDDFREILSHLEKSTNETSMLLDNLLYWTKLKTGVIPFMPGKSDLKSLINESAELLSGNTENKNISVNINIEDDLTACFDDITMGAVFRNVILNSIKFTPAGGHINIEGAIESDKARISIKDNGVGISRDIIDKVFTRNEHHTSPGTDNESGSGLGSFIIKDFVHKNNGRLEIISEPGEGTDVRIFLPLKEGNGSTNTGN